ncbi:MAG TPA: sensor histidine kinase, partial [Anaerolineae bacterium]|nr:sensor histidine kinase [Anaerolineae bacterium]
TVRDDGAGLPADFRAGESDGLGLELIRTLVEEDLGGEFRLAANGDGGTTATVRLPLAAISVDRRLTYV